MESEQDDRNKWAIDWDDCDGEDIPGDGDLMEIFVRVVQSVYMK